MSRSSPAVGSTVQVITDYWVLLCPLGHLPEGAGMFSPTSNHGLFSLLSAHRLCFLRFEALLLGVYAFREEQGETRASPLAQTVNTLPATWETQV